MNKKTWVPAEIIALGVESTEATAHHGKRLDGQYCDGVPQHELYS